MTTAHIQSIHTRSGTKDTAADFSGLASTPADLTTTVQALVDRLREAVNRAAELEAEFNLAKAEATRLATVEIPDAMGTLTEIRLADGSTLSVKDDLNASVSEANRPEAWTWLREHGHGGVIKQAFEIDARGMDDKVRTKFLAGLAKLGLAPECSETVHASALKSLCKELLEKGIKLPPSFSIFQFKKATVKAPKGRK